MKKSLLALAIAASVTAPAYASTAISGGIWLNHQLTTEDTGSDGSVREESTLGTVNSEALILYIDHQQEDSAWQLSAEWRTGPGSFSDSSNNSTGDTSGFHKLWVGYNFSKDRKVVIGKSQVPFGFGTMNFWPGDMGLGGYGDQLDVGVKFSDKQDAISYDLAWYIADDFGATSTDTMDDNGHWGTSTTYRKVNTAVANIGYDLTPGSTIGFSYQQGELQNLTRNLLNTGFANDTGSLFGDHNAWDVWYTGTYGNVGVKAQVMGTQRNGLDEISAGADEVKTLRQSLTVSYATGPFNYYIDYTNVASDTDGNNASDMVAFAPGVSYNYGPGWIYAEYLTQSNYLDGNSDVTDTGNASNDESNFSATYLTIDYYF
ncbi:MAG: hypothetical protein ACI910_000023 [Oleispira sp.]|jgi:hypothetical protein